MAAISTSDIKNGITLKIDDGLFSVIEFQHVKPGKGGAFVRTKLRNARTGAVIERTYRSDERLEQAIIDKRDTQYLYRDGDDYIFMDQVNLRPGARLVQEPGRRGELPQGDRQGDAHPARRRDHRRRAAGVGRARRSPRPSRASRATACRARASPPPSRPGFVVQVPLFVGPGEIIKVDTRTGEYMTRA